MKQLRLIALVLAASACCVALAYACGGAKSASASAAGSSCCPGGTTATAANAKGAKGAKSAKGSECTPEMQAACTPEMRAACSANKGASAGASCSMHGATATAGSSCSGGSMAAHMDCAVCSDQMGCDEDVRSAGAHTQVVALKNGAMIVYTANTPENVRALQATVARHNTAVVSVLTGQRDGKLCAGCKPLRGAMASGKLRREVINVQRGAQIVVTSTDRSMVQRIHNMTGAEMAARVRD